MVEFYFKCTKLSIPYKRDKYKGNKERDLIFGCLYFIGGGCTILIQSCIISKKLSYFCFIWNKDIDEYFRS